MKISILFSNFGPYHLARVRSFQQICHQTDWSLTGIELARSQAEYPWKTQLKQWENQIVSVINNQKLEQTKFFLLVKKLYLTLSQTKPDILVISGYSRPSMLSALLWSMWHQKPAILFSESKENDALRKNYQEKIKSRLVKLYKAALVGGLSHKNYLAKLGMPTEAIFYGYDVVDNEVFHPHKIKLLPNPLKKPYFLAINRFVPKKNLLLLISAYANYRQLAGDSAWDLVLCGDGELRSEIEGQIANLNLQTVVHLPGFLQQKELLPYFAHAGCFIHASIQEQWGLVVNEAMAAGLPVLVSNRCGCFEDLVIEGVNGFGFDPENPQQLTELMLKISLGEINLAAIGQAALEHIQKYSPNYFAQGLKQAVEYAIAHG